MLTQTEADGERSDFLAVQRRSVLNLKVTQMKDADCNGSLARRGNVNENEDKGVDMRKQKTG